MHPFKCEHIFGRDLGVPLLTGKTSNTAPPQSAKTWPVAPYTTDVYTNRKPVRESTGALR